MAGKIKKSAKRVKKEDYWYRLQKSVNDYKNVLFIDANNVSSLQVLKIRAALRKIGAVMIMGKNVSHLHHTSGFSTIYVSFVMFFNKSDKKCCIDLDESFFDCC